MNHKNKNYSLLVFVVTLHDILGNAGDIIRTTKYKKIPRLGRLS